MCASGLSKRAFLVCLVTNGLAECAIDVFAVQIAMKLGFGADVLPAGAVAATATPAAAAAAAAPAAAGHSEALDAHKTDGQRNAQDVKGEHLVAAQDPKQAHVPLMTPSRSSDGIVTGGRAQAWGAGDRTGLISPRASVARASVIES